MTVTPIEADVLRTALPKGLDKKTGRTRNQTKNRDHLDHSIFKIG